MCCEVKTLILTAENLTCLSDQMHTIFSSSMKLTEKSYFRFMLDCSLIIQHRRKRSVQQVTCVCTLSYSYSQFSHRCLNDTE